MTGAIYSVAFSRDNQSVFISDWDGNIKLIKWKAGADSWDDFDLTEEPREVGDSSTFSICLTKDEKYLLIGSDLLVSISETTTRKVIKEFNITTIVRTVSLIEDGKKAIIAENNGNLSVIDLETLEISLIAKNIKNGENLNKIIVI